jgi:hypothetical protein
MNIGHTKMKIYVHEYNCISRRCPFNIELPVGVDTLSSEATYWTSTPPDDYSPTSKYFVKTQKKSKL